MIRRPPEHRADAPALFIPEFDDAWDTERVEKAKTEGDDAVTRYHEGLTRYDLDAQHTVGGMVVKARDYLRDDAKPTVFKLQRVSGLERAKAAAMFGDLVSQQDAMWRLVKLGVTEVTDGFDGTPWPLRGGQGGIPLTDEDVQVIYDAEPNLIHAVGLAVYRTAAPLSGDEGKR